MSKNTKKKKSPLSFLLILIAIGVILLAIFRKTVFPANTFINRMYDEDLAGDTTVKLAKILVIIFGGYLVAKFAALIRLIGNKFSNSSKKTAFLLVSSLMKYASVIGVILMGLNAWGVDTSGMVSIVSVITLIIGVGCKSLVSDIVTGFFLLIEGDIQVNDIVVINGWRGTVREIGLRRVSIEDDAGNINTVSNSKITNVINNTRKLSVANADVVLSTQIPVEKAESVFTAALEDMRKDIPMIMEGPTYRGVVTLNANDYTIRIDAICKEYDKYKVERSLNRKVRMLLEKGL